MTPQETLHEISVMVYRNTDDFEMRISKDCYKGLVNALEKQIPKKLLDIEGDYTALYGSCPNCKNIVCDNEDYRFCNECGQALDWGESE